MNAVFFGLKRAYYGTLRAPRKPLREIDMSSARYDMLTAIVRYPKILQRDLRRVLGVVPATVCKMLCALEDLGYVERREARDRRQRIVEITPKGRWAIRESDRLMFEREFLQDTPFVHIPGADGRFWQTHYWDINWVWFVEETARMQNELGMSFGPYPPWHPQD
jgi:DNA-binding MarR family transcriptional regulator